MLWASLTRLTLFIFLTALLMEKINAIHFPVEKNIVGSWNAVVSFCGQSHNDEVILNVDKTGNSLGKVF